MSVAVWLSGMMDVALNDRAISYNYVVAEESGCGSVAGNRDSQVALGLKKKAAVVDRYDRAAPRGVGFCSRPAVWEYVLIRTGSAVAPTPMSHRSHGSQLLSDATNRSSAVRETLRIKMRLRNVECRNVEEKKRRRILTISWMEY